MSAQTHWNTCNISYNNRIYGVGKFFAHDQRAKKSLCARMSAFFVWITCAHFCIMWETMQVGVHSQKVCITCKCDACTTNTEKINMNFTFGVALFHPTLVANAHVVVLVAYFWARAKQIRCYFSKQTFHLYVFYISVSVYFRIGRMKHMCTCSNGTTSETRQGHLPSAFAAAWTYTILNISIHLQVIIAASIRFSFGRLQTNSFRRKLYTIACVNMRFIWPCICYDTLQIFGFLIDFFTFLPDPLPEIFMLGNFIGFTTQSKTANNNKASSHDHIQKLFVSFGHVH